MDLLRDTIWQFIGVFVSILAIIITIALFYFQKNKKELTWIILSKSPLLNTKSKEITVYHNNVSIDSVYITEVKIANTGSTPILPTDYVEKTGILFKETDIILSAEVTKVEPDTINASFEIYGNKVLMSPILLNPKDSVNFRLLTKSSYDEFRIIGRIVGIKAISKQVVEKYINSKVYLSAFWISVGVLTFGVTGIVLSIIMPTSSMKASIVAILTGLILIPLARLYAKYMSK